MKRFCALLLLIVTFCLIGNVGVLAAPDVVPADVAGNTYELIVVTNPQNQKASTFDSGYIISGYGKEGTSVTLYWHDAEEDVYKKIYNESQYIDENGNTQTTYNEATTTIGASGLFMNKVVLAQGGNNILVRAENGEEVQTMRLSITRYTYNLFDIIKSLTD